MWATRSLNRPELQTEDVGRRSDRLLFAIRCAYWLALMLMAAVTIASFLLLQHMIDDRRSDDALVETTSAQWALSQRVLYLAQSVSSATRASDKAALTATLRETVTRFETDYDQLLDHLDSHQEDGKMPTAFAEVLFAAPYHLDYFAAQVSAMGWRLVASLEDGETGQTSMTDYLGEAQAQAMQELIGNATLEGFQALIKQISAHTDVQTAALMKTHRNLFFLAMMSLAAIALLIFRPMTTMIARRTQELEKARNAMAHAASHDALTGLMNRADLMATFPVILERAKLLNERVAVLQIDLDRFKQVNDTLGHAAGDLVLMRTAERLRAVCRANDFAVRLGGDEFVVILPAPGDFPSMEAIAKRLLDRINDPITFQGTPILPGASIGISVYPDDALEPHDLMVHADLALYSAKRLGGGSSAFFSGELREELDQLKEFAQDIKSAVVDRSFSVFYQPQLDLKSGAVTGVEALVRWRHPERGTVSPSIFLPIAEKSGLMARIGRIVLKKAITDAGAWHRDGVQFGRLAINVTSAELREPDFERFIHQTLADAGLPASRLSLEIVESVILDDERTGIATKLRALRASGISLELDDFGTGYASLTHIDPSQIDRIKIDRRFVQDIHLRPDSAKIVRAMSELAQALGLGVIAEGAESQAELDLLMRIGCPAVQGYVIAFPMPEAEAKLWLTQRWSLAVGPTIRIAAG